jgi:hypothetical protein
MLIARFTGALLSTAAADRELACVVSRFDFAKEDKFRKTAGPATTAGCGTGKDWPDPLLSAAGAELIIRPSGFF